MSPHSPRVLQRGIARSSVPGWAAILQVPVPLNDAIVLLSIACASTMVFLTPRIDIVVSEELIEQAEEEESGLMQEAGVWCVVQ